MEKMTFGELTRHLNTFSVTRIENTRVEFFRPSVDLESLSDYKRKSLTIIIKYLSLESEERKSVSNTLRVKVNH